MATSVGLNFRLTAAVDKFESSMKDVEKRLGGIEKSSRQTATGMKLLAGMEIGRSLLSGLNKIFDIFKAGVSSVTSFTSSASSAADAIGKLSSTTGMAEESLQVFTQLASYSGVAAGQFGDAIQKMSRGLGEASSGTGTAGRAIERLGLNLDQLLGMSPAEQFLMIGGAIGRISDPAMRSATAADIFGRSGTKLIPMFENLEQNASDLAQEMLSLGQVLSKQQVDNIEAMNDSFEKVKKTASAIGTQVLANFAPALTAANNAVLELIKNFEYDGAKGGQAIANMLSDALISGAKVLVDWAEMASNIFISFGSALMKAAELFLRFVAEFAGVADLIYMTFAPLTRTLTGGIEIPEETIQRIRELADSAGAASESLWETKADFSGMRATLDEMGNSVKEAAASVTMFDTKTTASADTMADWIEGSFDAEAAMGDLASSLGDAAGTVPIDLKAHGRAAWEAAQEAKNNATALARLSGAAELASNVVGFLKDPTATVAAGMQWLVGHVRDVAAAAGFTEEKLLELARAADIAKGFRTKLFDQHMTAWDRQATMVRDRLISNGMNAFDANYMMMQARNEEVQRVNGILDVEQAKHLKNVMGLTVNTENAGKAIADAGKVLGEKLNGAATTAAEWATGIAKDATDWFGGLFGDGDSSEGPEMPEAEETLPELQTQTAKLDDILSAAKDFGSNFIVGVIG